MSIFKKRPSPAMIVAISALVVSLAGTAVAGPIAEISLNRGEKQQVRKISRNISGKVSNRRITKRAPGLNVATARNAVIANVANASNFAHTATDAKNAENAENAKTADSAPPSGPAGGDLTGDYPDPSIANNTINSSKIINGQVRAADLGVITEVEVDGEVPNNDNEDLTANCPAGTKLISGGGGIDLLGPPAGVAVTASLRVGNGWRIIVRNDSGAARNIFVEAQCLQG